MEQMSWCKLEVEVDSHKVVTANTSENKCVDAPNSTPCAVVCCSLVAGSQARGSASWGSLLQCRKGCSHVSCRCARLHLLLRLLRLPLS